MLALPPLSLYVHIPWCVRKCPYCDFNSHEQSGDLPQATYVKALLDDLDLDLNYAQGRELRSIFIGGGTPSLFAPQMLENLLGGIKQRLPVSTALEVTMEANPGTVEAGRFRDFRQAGVNRLSLGIQSFDNAKLKVLGRIHDASQARRAIEVAIESGFSNMNLDLMYGLPEQTPAEAIADLRQALEFSTVHLSWYQLTIEPNTGFYASPPVLPGEDEILTMQEQGLLALETAGLGRYEISAYSRPGAQSRHNLNYWQFGDYLGIGAGAHGKLTIAIDDAVLRTRKYRQPEHYLRQNLTFTAETNRVDRAELPLEFMLNALRLSEGFSIVEYEARTGLAFSEIRKKIEWLRDGGYLAIFNNEANDSPRRVVPTSKGLLFANNLLEEFL
ncbi:MAG: radical SAM family heme chaperone HemW [Pseudohongiellaceae bacterium]